MKVVFDTSILVSAIVFPGGRADEALHRIIEEQDVLVLSKPVLDELLGVLARKFSRDAEELAHLAVFLTSLAEMAAPARRLRALKDGADNRTLECAVAGRADATGRAEVFRRPGRPGTGFGSPASATFEG